MKQVDTASLKLAPEMGTGSSPVVGTKFNRKQEFALPPVRLTISGLHDIIRGQQQKGKIMIFYFVEYTDAGTADCMCEFFGTKKKAKKAARDHGGADITKINPKTKDEFLARMNVAAAQW